MARKQVKNLPLSHNNLLSAGKGSWKDYFSDSFFDDCAKSDQWRTNLIEALSEFGQNHEHLFILEFCALYKIPRRTLYKLAARYPDIKLAFDDMRSFLGLNRCKKVPLQFVMAHDQHRYDSEWEEDEVRKAELNKSPEPKQPDIKVVISKPDVISKEEMQRE